MDKNMPDKLRELGTKPITKRQLGLVFILGGLAGIVGPLLVDFLGAGQFQGIGGTQRLVMVAALVVLVVGLTLLPLDDRPA
jgi:sugar phosphate permease